MSQAKVSISSLSGVDNGHQISISGKLDETNADEESKAVYTLLQKAGDKPKILLNLKGLSYMNSKSVGYIADWHGKISKAGGKMAIVNASENITDILSVVGLTSLIDMLDSVDDAKKALG